MAKFKGIVQIYREVLVEAETQEQAMVLLQAEVGKMQLTDRYNINMPTNLDKKAAKKKGKKV